MSRMVDEFWKMVDEDTARQAAERQLIDRMFPVPEPKVLHMESLPKPPVVASAHMTLQ